MSACLPHPAVSSRPALCLAGFVHAVHADGCLVEPVHVIIDRVDMTGPAANVTARIAERAGFPGMRNPQITVVAAQSSARRVCLAVTGGVAEDVRTAR